MQRWFGTFNSWNQILLLINSYFSVGCTHKRKKKDTKFHYNAIEILFLSFRFRKRTMSKKPKTEKKMHHQLLRRSALSLYLFTRFQDKNNKRCLSERKRAKRNETRNKHKLAMGYIFFSCVCTQQKMTQIKTKSDPNKNYMH